MSGESGSGMDGAARILSGSGCVVLTGAGISVPSGIPDFRSKEGLWEKFDPMVYATAQAWRSSPDRVWQMFRETGRMMLTAEPNAAHSALAELERGGWIEAVVTQNIDGLHQAAGSKRVVEFHGNAVDVYCESCGRTADRAEVLGFLDLDEAPRCAHCGGLVRPSVVLFGEPIPPDALRHAAALAGTCRSMLVVGTSAVVAPASLLPLEAQASGAPIIEVNPETTELSPRAEITLRGRAEVILPELAGRLRMMS
jgi:NAD-dependent deacetylase